MISYEKTYERACGRKITAFDSSSDNNRQNGAKGGRVTKGTADFEERSTLHHLCCGIYTQERWCKNGNRYLNPVTYRISFGFKKTQLDIFSIEYCVGIVPHPIAQVDIAAALVF